jgi:hypothetical protein
MPRIAATTMLALLLMVGQHARAAEPKVITLSCDGTFTNVTPEPMEKMGVVVNLDERTVSFAGYVARFKEADPGSIAFFGTQDDEIGIMGVIDRITGHMDAMITFPARPTNENDPKKFGPRSTFRYDLLCKVGNRLF